MFISIRILKKAKTASVCQRISALDKRKGCQIPVLNSLKIKAHLPAPVMYFIASWISRSEMISSSPRTVRIIQKN